MSGGITHITSSAQLDKLLTAQGSKLTVIDFHATWCGPCHAIAPKYEAFAKENTGVQFLKCDVDAVPEVAQKYKIAAMPTFIFIVDSAKIDQVRGADPSSLEATIRKHAGANPGAFSGKGQTLGGGPDADTPAAAPSVIDPQMAVFAGLGDRHEPAGSTLKDAETQSHVLGGTGASSTSLGSRDEMRARALEAAMERQNKAKR